MREVFADTSYWIALNDPVDRWHLRARHATDGLGSVLLITTEAVLIEFLNFFAEAGAHRRREAVRAVAQIRASLQVRVIPPGAYPMLADGIVFYSTREDKGYSLTDCLSMLVMRDREIYQVLTFDAHFAQEGFVTLPQ